MPTFMSNEGSLDASGEFGFNAHGPDVSVNSRLIIPNGATLPAVTHADGQMYYVTVSGALCITAGGAWNVRSNNSTQEGAFQAVGKAPMEFEDVLEVWCNNSGITVATDGESGVDRWANAAPGNVDLLQNDSNHEPFVESGSLNGLEAMYFDGAGFMENGAIAASHFSGNDMPITVIMAVRELNAANVNEVCFSMRRGGDLNPVFEFFVDDDENDMSAFKRANDNGTAQVWTNQVGNNVSPWPQTPIIFSAVTSGTTMAMRVSGITVFNASGWNTNTQTLDQLAVGALWDGSTKSIPWHGYIYEIAVFSSGLPIRDVACVEQFMADRWGIAHTSTGAA